MLALLVLGAEVVSLFAAPVVRPLLTTQDFPPLVMVWREADAGNNRTPWTQTFQLDYSDPCHQRVTQLDHSEMPSVAGLYTEFDGRTSISHIPGYVPDVIRTLEPNDCWPPDRYLLIPIAFDNPRQLANRPGWVQHAAGDGLQLVSHDDTVVVADGIVAEHIEITYRPNDGLPLHVVDVVNGREVQRRDVLELHVATERHGPAIGVGQ